MTPRMISTSVSYVDSFVKDSKILSPGNANPVRDGKVLHMISRTFSQAPTKYKDRWRYCCVMSSFVVSLFSERVHRGVVTIFGI